MEVEQILIISMLLNMALSLYIQVMKRTYKAMTKFKIKKFSGGRCSLMCDGVFLMSFNSIGKCNDWVTRYNRAAARLMEGRTHRF